MAPVFPGSERAQEFSGGEPASTGWAGESHPMIGLRRRPAGRGSEALLSFGNCASQMPAEGLQCARLETRTKECNMRASRWVANP